MTRLSLLFTAICLSQAAFAQLSRPVLLNGPEAQGSSLLQAKEVVQLAAQHGYNGVTLGIGMQRFSNPNNIDLSGVKEATDLAMQLGLQYVCWRLDADVPNNQAWANAYNDGVIWPIHSRPVPAAWPRISQIWQAARDISAQSVAAAGKSPGSTLMFVLGNEPGLGGTGGPSLGPWSFSGFFYSLYQATGDETWFLIAFPPEFLGQPEGYIEPGYWTMMRNIRGPVKFGAKVYAVSFEGGEASLPAQIASVVGPDAQALYANCHGYAMNVFAPNARRSFDSITGTVTKAPATPTQAANALKARIDGLLPIPRANPILANEGIVLTEFNISTGRIENFADAFPYRTKLLKDMSVYPGLDATMIFTAYTTQQSTQSMQLFNRFVIAGQVQIIPVGSQAVGPAYFHMVP